MRYLDSIFPILENSSDSEIKKFKEEFGVKARMIKPEQTLEYIGHEIGGICPFGIKNNVDVDI